MANRGLIPTDVGNRPPVCSTTREAIGHAMPGTGSLRYTRMVHQTAAAVITA